ncbi:MAG: TonB-dependent receptor [Bryobacterales bacterium]|nr:TonB-dependent receptor [Bryobacterales bacterium]
MMTSGKSCNRFLPLVLLGVLATGLHAQEFRGRIQGTVVDTSQASVVGATVTLLNVYTGVSATRQTNETGSYIFDLLNPGTYTVTVEFAGFSKSAQEGIILQQRGDIALQSVLKPGDIKETVTVSAEASMVQFNTAKLDTTVDSRLVNNLPQIYRSPFLLAQLDPAVEKNDGGTEFQPYHSWGPNNQRIGGGALYSNDLQVDGAAVGIGYKTGYVPSPDMVQEVNVQQNAVDAEYGNSSGSNISLTLKSGTNVLHGTAFYQGQYPWANAYENRVFRTINLGRTHMYGGTVSHPILKNKLFNFVAYEGWNKTDPQTHLNTLPTDLERTGDFSQSLNGSGGLRTIYDPWTTKTSADGATITRTPYPGNKIPASAQDPVATHYLSKLWKPNRAGTGNYHLQNFAAPLPISFPYKNFSDRADFQVTERLRVSGRYSMFVTPVSATNPTGSDYFQSDRGSQRDAKSYTGDVTWTATPNTVLNFRGEYHNFVDASKYDKSFADTSKWAEIWPNSQFYKQTFAAGNVPILLPRISISGTDNARLLNMGPGGGYWDQRPNGDMFSFKISQQRGSHYLKAGADTRGSRAKSFLSLANPGFGFDTNPTNATYVSPNTLTSGDAYATFLIGAVAPTSGGANAWDSNGTSMPILAFPSSSTRTYGAFINDDWKISRDLTLNLGLRYEFQRAYTEEQDRLTLPLDLTDPIPEFQGAGAPKMPAEVKQFYSGPWTFNGAYKFAESGHRGEWNSGKGTWSPRIGMAYRMNDKTSIRAAYGRYITPWTNANSNMSTGGTGANLLEVLVPGSFSYYTGAYSAVQGVPVMNLKNPFPSEYPVVPTYQKTLGRYTSLGDSVTYMAANRTRQHSDRFNVSWQRQLPTGMILDVTYFLNLSSFAWDLSRDLNMVDPRIAYQYKAATNVQVANPFYNILPVQKFPGTLRSPRTVGITSLMKPYPHYGSINVTEGQPGGNMRYQSIQFKVQKNFSKGYSMLFGYNYHRQSDQRFFDNIAQYLQQYTEIPSDASRNRLTFAATWEVPFGKGRQYMSGAPRLLDALLGGWNITPTGFWRSGRLIRFGSLVVSGDPHVSDPNQTRWFDKSVFSIVPAYTARTNPWQYDDLMGPQQYNMDASLVKSFQIIERFRFELRMDVFNVLNNITWNNPDTSVTSANFGRSANNDQLTQTYGRRAQLGLRLQF